MARGVICAAGVTLVFLGGCASMDYLNFSFWQRDSSGNSRAVTYTQNASSTNYFLGNADAVALRLQTGLKEMGMQPQVSRDSEGIRITSVTKSGKQLSMVLKRDMSSGTGEKTKVDVEWANGIDNDVSAQLQYLAAIGGSR